MSMRRAIGLKRVVLIVCSVLLLLLSLFTVQGLFVPVRIVSGSMAETFWGPHYTICCQDCQFCFPVDATSAPRVQTISCPNCGAHNQRNENQSVLPGDRVLVDRMSYYFRDPYRWEPVLFRSVDPPVAHCLKRVAGLPNENVAISAGDIWINGTRLKKNWPTLDALALVVHDSRFTTKNLEAPLRWRPLATENNWEKTPRGYQQLSAAVVSDQEKPIDWIGYHHLDFHRGHPRATDQITDDYAYNQTLSRRLHSTDDLILSAQVQCHGGGSLFFQVGAYRLQLDCDQESDQGCGKLLESSNEIAEFVWDPQKLQSPAQVEVATVDKQFFFVVDGNVIFSCDLESVAIPAIPRVPSEADCLPGNENISRLAVGSQSLRVTVSDLRVRRDVYYTPEIVGVLANRTGDYRLGEDEFFVLGDNSPVSLDSRRDAAVAIVLRADLLGRVWRWR
jgi:signal peptidase I